MNRKETTVAPFLHSVRIINSYLDKVGYPVLITGLSVSLSYPRKTTKINGTKIAMRPFTKTR